MELPDEDRPPEHIWLNAEELDNHFSHVRDRYRNNSGAEESPDLDEQNDLTKGLK